LGDDVKDDEYDDSQAQAYFPRQLGCDRHQIIERATPASPHHLIPLR
jgi:hypothetical protein